MPVMRFAMSVLTLLADPAKVSARIPVGVTAADYHCPDARCFASGSVSNDPLSTIDMVCFAAR